MCDTCELSRLKAELKATQELVVKWKTLYKKLKKISDDHEEYLWRNAR